MQRRKTTGDTAGAARATLEPVARLTAADVFTAADRRAIEHFIQISKQR